jgi:uncharacterized protein with FMN-binding domain
VARTGGKGKISNNLVAASCAAVLTVYAAGYWRTRDAARRFEIQALEREAAPAGDSAALSPAATALAAPAMDTPSDTVPVDSPPVAAASPAPARAATIAAQEATTRPTPDAPAQATPMPSAVENSAVVDAVAGPAETAPEPAVIAANEALPVPAGNWRDGSYSGWGTSRHGDIKAQVVIRNGRIVEASILSCETRWPCDVISTIFNQPVERQSADVDRVSRATESANAYYFALVAALGDALAQAPDQTTAR